MLQLKRKFEFRVSDRLAVVAAFMLSLCAAGGLYGHNTTGEPGLTGEPKSTNQQVTSPDATSDESTHRKTIDMGLLLFRHG